MRIVYRFAERLVQSVVQVTYGVDNSHVLNEWIEIDAVQLLDDYGYGRVYDYTYDIDISKFYQTSMPAKSAPAKTDAPKAVTVSETVVIVSESAECGAGLRRNIFNYCEPVFKPIAN